uniref:Uncharacterized protein n=1 Tax=Panagrolaimus sp. PS1159 TaxID=55785 RepID=A0AC35EW48_9BILA
MAPSESRTVGLNDIDIECEDKDKDDKKESVETQNPNLLMIKTDKQKLAPSVSYISQISVTSTISTVSNDEGNEDPWPYNHYAKNYVIGLITVFYAVILIVYNMTLSLWFWNLDENDKVAEKEAHNQFTVFSYYSFGAGLIFFAYCYILILLKPRRWEEARNIFHKLFPNRWKKSFECKETERVMPDIGCLYLRFGAMFNTKHDIISRFGTMHLTAVNFNIAFQFIFEKTQSNQKSIDKVFKIAKNGSIIIVPVNATTTLATTIATTATAATVSQESGELSEENESENSTALIRVVRAAAEIVTSSGAKAYVVEDCGKKIECILGSFTKVFYTGVIEYSIIATAIFFIVWHNIERIQGHELTHKIQKKSTIRINCSKMVIGLFGGYAFVIGTFISMVLFYGYYGQSQYFNAANTYNTTDIIQHCIGFIACVFALWRIRLLKYVYHDPHSHDPHHASHSNQLLDMILLAVGLIGELCFSISGLMVS